MRPGVSPVPLLLPCALNVRDARMRESFSFQAPFPIDLATARSIVIGRISHDQEICAASLQLLSGFYF